jgi:DNA primase
MTKNMIDFQAIKDAVDILEIARQYVELRRHGREWVGPCPMCRAGDDRFYVNPHEKKWGCRKCGTGGDVTNLVAKVENLTNGQAAQRLTGGSFLTVAKAITPIKPARIATDATEAERLQLWSVETVNAGIRALRGERGQMCRDYLNSRGISQETAEAFRFGFYATKRDPVDQSTRPALVIPWIEGTTVTAIKYRFIDELAAQDKGRRFTQRIGSRPVLFGCHLVQSDPQRPRVIVAVEGEINAVSIYQATKRDLCDVVSIGSKKTHAGLDALDELIHREKYQRVLIWTDEQDDAIDAGERLRHHRPKLMKSPDGMDANDVLRTSGDRELVKLLADPFG